MNCQITVTTIIGADIGSKILKNILKKPAPSILAAFTNSVGTDTINHQSTIDNKFINANTKSTLLDTTTDINVDESLSKVNELKDIKKVNEDFHSNQIPKFPKFFNHKW